MTQPQRLHHLFLAMLGFAALPCAFAGELEGTVLNQDGKPVANAVVAAVPWETQRGPDGQVLLHIGSSDSQGHFLLRDLPAGSYGATATSSNQGSAFLDNLAIPDKGVVGGRTFELEGPPIVLQGKLTSSAGAIPDGAIIGADRVSESQGDTFFGRVEGNHFKLSLAPGRYHLAVRAPGWTSLAVDKVLVATSPAMQIDFKLMPQYGSQPELAKEIIAMEEVDQKVRFDWIQNKDEAHVKAMQEIDDKNEQRVKQILEGHGWPSAELVGPRAENALWTLVQHESPAMIKQCLPGMKAAADKGELAWSTVALSVDRDLLNDKKKQLYGSQVNIENGKVDLLPVEDEAHLDERRAKVGLEPIAEYKANILKLYEPH